MARSLRQILPQPPPVYDQAYIARLTDAVNRYIIQKESQGEEIAARFIMTDPPAVSTTAGDYPNNSQLPTGTLYLVNPSDAANAPAGTKFLTVRSRNPT